MKTRKQTALVALAVIALASSCSKEQFDRNLYNEEVSYQFMVDNADPNHDWCLTKNATITVRASETSVYRVQLLTADPYTAAGAEIVAESAIFGGAETLTYTVPATTQTLYVEAYDREGYDLGCMPITYGTESLNLKTADLTKSGTIYAAQPQTFTYLYESSFPQPEDFDFNDMVLRISKRYPSIGNMYEIDLTVKLEACGAGELYAAAIQLDGIKYDDIEKVEIVNGKPMDDGYPLNIYTLTKTEPTKIWQRGHNGNAVIRLFECAQWALSRQTDYAGDISIIHYNTTHEDVENQSATISPVTATYRITFKDADVAHKLTFDCIDPFIIHQDANSGGIFEVHTYAHKFDLCISDIETNLRAYDNHVSWALVIPKRDFRYPSEGMSICNYNKDTDETFGPYMGFAEWMKNRLGNRSWYQTLNYPSMVY